MTACGLNGIAAGSPKGTLILSICQPSAKVRVRVARSIREVKVPPQRKIEYRETHFAFTKPLG